MAKWLTVHLSGEQRFVSPNTLAEMHEPHMFIDDPQARQRFGFELQCYGLGWSLLSYKGQAMLSHSGGIDGFASLVSFLPRHQLGVVVLSNGDGVHNAIPSIISYTIYDRLAKLERTDWNAKLRPLYDEMLEAHDRSADQSMAERRDAPPSHPLDDYLGDYEHPGYGVYSIRRRDQALELVMNDKLSLALAHYHYDVFEAYLERFDLHLKLSFTTHLKGNIGGFATQVEPMVKAVDFVRLPERQLSDAAFLTQFAGEYELQGMRLLVEMRDGKLFASLPGQAYELVPYAGTEFALKDMPGFSISFRQDNRGVFSRAVLSQPGYVFAAERK